MAQIVLQKNMKCLKLQGNGRKYEWDVNGKRNLVSAMFMEWREKVLDMTYNKAKKYLMKQLVL